MHTLVAYPPQLVPTTAAVEREGHTWCPLQASPPPQR